MAVTLCNSIINCRADGKNHILSNDFIIFLIFITVVARILKEITAKGSAGIFKKKGGKIACP